MIVSQCSTITRPTIHNTADHQTHQHVNEEDVYQNTNEGYYSDEVYNSNTNSHTHPTLPRTISQPNDYYVDPLEGNPAAFGRGKMVPRDNDETHEYGNVDSPRVVSGEYGYIQPLEYVPRNYTDDTPNSRNGSDDVADSNRKVSDGAPIRDRNDSDASYLEPLEFLNGGNQGNDIRDVTAVTMGIDEPIYEYDNVCEPLGDDEEIYANVN